MNLKAHRFRSEGVQLMRREYMSVDNAVEHAGFGPAQIRYIIAAGVVFFTEVQLAVSGGLLLPSISCEWHLQKWQVLTLLMSGSFSSTIGGLLGGKLADKFGRKKNVVFGQFLQIMLTALSLIQHNFYLFVACRSAAHFFFMLVKPAATCMTLEICPRRSRFFAKMVLAVSGQLGAVACAMLASRYLHVYGWRDLTLMLTLPCFIPLVMYVFLDESPRFLLVSGKPDKGTEVIRKIYRLNKTEDLSYLIKHRQDHNRGSFKELFTPEFEKTTYLLMALFIIKNLIMTTLHLSIPYILQGDYCSPVANTLSQSANNSNNTIETAQCHDLSARHIHNLMKGYAAGIVVLVLAIGLSQIIGRKRAGIIAYLLASACFFSNIWCQGKDMLVLKISGAMSFHHGAGAVMTLFIQEIYPTSVRALATGVIYTVGHAVSLAGPAITVYWIMGRERDFFLVAGVVFVVCAMLVRKINHESLNEPLHESTKEYYQEDSDWDIELDYDM